MKTIDINKLNSIFGEECRTRTQQMHLSDTFANACFLHSSGHERAGRKLIMELFDQIGWDRRKTYFLNLLDSLNGNEKTYGLAVNAHEEIKALFDMNGNTSESTATENSSSAAG